MYGPPIDQFDFDSGESLLFAIHGAIKGAYPFPLIRITSLYLTYKI